MEIRPYKPQDLDTLFDIDQACFPPGIAYSRSELARFIGFRQAKTWVACSGKEIEGFVIMGQEPQRVAHVVTIDVIQEKRGQGIGKALMNTVDDWARRQSLRLIYLETAEDNRSAQEFYTARGYVKVEKIANYYANGQTAWVMVKWL